MTYDKLLEILLSDNVCEQFTQNEQEIFELIPELKVCKGFEQNNNGTFMMFMNIFYMLYQEWRIMYI